MCCFSYLSQTRFIWLRGINIKIKRKTNKKLHENAKFVEKLSIFKKLFCFPDFSQLFLMINVHEDPKNKKSIESGLIFL